MDEHGKLRKAKPQDKYITDKDFPRRRLMPNEIVHPISPIKGKSPYFLHIKREIITITVLRPDTNLILHMGKSRVSASSQSRCWLDHWLKGITNVKSNAVKGMMQAT
jgi:hypothetical protein